jgi:hypothetical protein
MNGQRVLICFIFGVDLLGTCESRNKKIKIKSHEHQPHERSKSDRSKKKVELSALGPENELTSIRDFDAA